MHSTLADYGSRTSIHVNDELFCKMSMWKKRFYEVSMLQTAANDVSAVVAETVNAFCPREARKVSRRNFS